MTTVAAARPEAEDNPHAYAPAIWRLFRTAPRAGRFPANESGVVTGEAGTPAARAVLRLQLKFVGGRVADARFQAYGCPTSIAVGAWIADWARGRTPAELAVLRAVDLRRELEIPEDRAHCALLGEDAVKAVLAGYKESVP